MQFGHLQKTNNDVGGQLELHFTSHVQGTASQSSEKVVPLAVSLISIDLGPKVVSLGLGHDKGYAKVVALLFYNLHA